MTRARSLILLGILIALTPFVGIPLSFLAWILPVFGLMVFLTGFSFRRQVRTEEPVVEAPAPAPAFDIHEPIAHQ